MRLALVYVLLSGCELLLEPLPLHPVTALTAGAAHTCAVVGGEASCWGSNGDLQLGLAEDVGSSPHPLLVAGLPRGVQDLAAGDDHTCALIGGGVWCWGSNSDGQLGDGSGARATAPVQVVGLSRDVRSIAAGGHHTCAIKDGDLWCWGSNNYGQLGDGSTVSRPAPVPVVGLGHGVQAVTTSATHTCAIVGGGAFCWGFNVHGQLGDGSTVNRLIPVQALGSRVQAIAAGDDHTCALIDDGAVCWGSNASHQLGTRTSNDSLAPVTPEGLGAGVTALVAHRERTYAIVTTSSGIEVRSWGCAFGARTDVPTRIGGLDGSVGLLALGDGHSCAADDAELRCWGDNMHGQLGDGSYESRPGPTRLGNRAREQN